MPRQGCLSVYFDSSCLHRQPGIRNYRSPPVAGQTFGLGVKWIAPASAIWSINLTLMPPLFVGSRICYNRGMSAKVQHHTPTIVSFVGDLMWSTRIENVARQLGYRVVQIESVASLGAPLAREQPNRPGEPVFGAEAMLADKITEWQPALLLFDLDYGKIPWRLWIAFLKSSPATRQIPVLGFAPHEDVEVLADARELGMDVVVGRSRFASNMPRLIEENSRVWDRDGIALNCREPMSDSARAGLEAFNRGEYFESHELLEDAWNEDDGAARDVYKAVLQVAVAYLQIERENYAGAVKMFLRARQWLAPLPDTCKGIDISRLRSDAQNVYQALIESGPERIGEIDRSLIQPVLYARKSP